WNSPSNRLREGFLTDSIPSQRRGQGLVLVIGLSLAHLSGEQGMQALQIERQTDQAPLASTRLLAALRELTESHHLFDDADDWLDCAFAHTIDRSPNRSFELVGHLHLGTGLIRWRRGRFGKALPPTRMMRIASGGDVRFDSPTLERCNIRFAKV